MPFVSRLDLRKVSGTREFELLAPLTYVGKLSTFVVPTGFRTDLFSVPWFARWLVDVVGVDTEGAVLHDYLCRTGLVPRKDADGLLRRSMREVRGAETFHVRRWLTYAGVRIGSLWLEDRHQPPRGG